MIQGSRHQVISHNAADYAEIHIEHIEPQLMPLFPSKSICVQNERIVLLCLGELSL